MTDNTDYKKQYAAARKAAADWENALETRYGEDDIMSIMGMLAYMDNIERGFGHLNDQALFELEKQADTDGRLYKEALHGFTLSKKYIQLRPFTKK